ncbi:hypothetical protein OG784_13035 [Streptomyces sp. NBC_01617]|uniref:hypothetical protein n=1 Tax=Streptomyces sp. NBC_01617 TaxID=2975899 RepID=UPI003866F519|nr:hypothetical protein OG784_13035 [Streptomyces sp. NBC_01617]
MKLAPTGLRRYTRKQERHDRDAARAESNRLNSVVANRDTRIGKLEEQNAQLIANAVDVSVERKLRAEAETKAAELGRALTACQSELANLRAITPVPAERDTRAMEDQATDPLGIPVRSLRALDPNSPDYELPWTRISSPQAA